MIYIRYLDFVNLYKRNTGIHLPSTEKSPLKIKTLFLTHKQRDGDSYQSWNVQFQRPRSWGWCCPRYVASPPGEGGRCDGICVWERHNSGCPGSEKRGSPHPRTCEHLEIMKLIGMKHIRDFEVAFY